MMKKALSVIMTVCMLIGILPIAYVLYHWKGVTVSWYSFPLAEILGTAYIIVMLRHLYIKEIKDL